MQSSQIESPAAVVCVRCSRFAKVQCGQAHCAGVAPGMTRATATSDDGGGAAARARGGGGAEQRGPRDGGQQQPHAWRKEERGREEEEVREAEVRWVEGVAVWLADQASCAMEARVCHSARGLMETRAGHSLW